VNPVRLARTLVEATSRALRGLDSASSAPLPLAGEPARKLAAGEPTLQADLCRTERFAVPAEATAEIDADAVASWIVSQYAGASYPGVIVGSCHGAAAHLAAALGVPWLPAGFETDVGWPGGIGADTAVAALHHGRATALRVLELNDGILIRQVHDPVCAGHLVGCQINLHLRWRWLPEAYSAFLANNLDQDAFILVIRDVRAWSALHAGDDYSFQLGSTASGLSVEEHLRGHTPALGLFGRATSEYAMEAGVEAELRQWARQHQARMFSVIYSDGHRLSAAVADLYREWLRGNGNRADRLVISSGRMVDPGQVLRTGLVPYWCETVTSPAVAAAELWLAGSTPFASIDVFPEPPGSVWSVLATPSQWRSLAAFATDRGEVCPAMARAYPLVPVPPRLATEALRRKPEAARRPAPLDIEVAVAGLRASASAGLLVSFGAGQ
jgi:hypothetical protein